MVIKCGRLHKRRRLFRFTWKSVGRQIESSERTSSSSVGSALALALLPPFHKALEQSPDGGSEKRAGGGEGVKALRRSEITLVEACGLLWKSSLERDSFWWEPAALSPPKPTSAPQGPRRKALKNSPQRRHRRLSHTAAATPLTIQERMQKNRKKEKKKIK